MSAFSVVLRGYHRGPVDADDLALMIRRRRFRTVPVGGHDPEDVEAFLDEIVARLRRR